MINYFVNYNFKRLFVFVDRLKKKYTQGQKGMRPDTVLEFGGRWRDQFVIGQVFS